MFGSIIQRLAYQCRGDRRFRYFNELKGNMFVSRDELIDIQNQSIHKLIRHAYESTKYYKNIFDKIGISPESIRNKNDLRALPFLTKTIVRENLNNLKSDDEYSKNLFEVTSGGSTGNQTLIYKSTFFEQMSRAAFLRNNLIANWNPEDRTVWIWGAPYEHAQIEDSLKAKIGIIINKRLLLNAYDYAISDFPVWVNRINNFSPKILYGYSSIISEFARYLVNNNIKLTSIKSVISTTETLLERKLIKEAFGCQVFDQYGSREILSIAIESEENIMRISDDTVVLNTDTNDEFVVTALHSYGFPLINYRIGDYGTVDDDFTANDGLPFTCARLKIGRTTDNFITNKNRKISSSALSTYISTSKISIIEQQIVQTDYDNFIVNYVPGSMFDFESYRRAVMDALFEYFGTQVCATFNNLDKIPVEKSGKKLMFKRTFNLEG